MRKHKSANARVRSSVRPLTNSETEISFAEVRRNGWKTIATLTEYAVQAFKNKMFYAILDVIDAGVTSGAENYITESTQMPTAASMDAMSLYMMEHDNGSRNIVALTKYIQAASKLNGFTSDEMINEVNRNGRLGVYDSCNLVPISSAKKLANGDTLIPDKRMFGICGKIGELDMKGSINIYQHEDTNKEKFHLKFADFTFGYSFNKDTLENVCVMHLA